ncbi:MAG: CCA tRNA nucleotidyltransferase [Ruminococcaceae bacterium]|nr:CCA tRNA nucleotidyltransferase [Oscillospiraceae bacterium]
MQKKMNLPKEAEYIISRLNSFGYRADVVGGCVRDSMLGKHPSDYDITTNASPKEMKAVFSDLKTVETGIKHGTLTVIINSKTYEVTTYRVDGEYRDNRHPVSVVFTDRLSEDLSRRDFTVNAMCYSHEHGYTDLYGGREDLENKLIRAVGDPVKRFNEDALRILRALRFASTLGFSIEPETSKAIFETAGLLKNISAERIYVEWRKLIGGVGAYEIVERYSPVIAEAIPELSGLNLSCRAGFDFSDASVRELMLFAMTHGESPEEYFFRAMTALKCDNKHKNYGYSVLKNYKEKTDGRVALNLLLVKVGAEVAHGVVDLKIALGVSQENEKKTLSNLLENGGCYRICDLKINGTDLLELGFRGKAVGDMLEKMLYLIAAGEAENDRTKLLSVVAKFL